MRPLVVDQFRLLTFREIRPDLRNHGAAYLGWGLFWTWIVGMGRYWDNPRADGWQLLGLGSLAYVFLLSLVLWLLIWPLGPRNWTYRTVLTFVTLTSLPALLYAIPVERFMDLPSAQTANLIFLLVVALWRVALLWVFLHRVAQLRGLVIGVACLLPLALIVVSLAALNLEHVVFNLMAGNGAVSQPGGNDAAYSAIVGLTLLSYLSAPVMLVLYASFVLTEWLRRRAERPPSGGGEGTPPG